MASDCACRIDIYEFSIENGLPGEGASSADDLHRCVPPNEGFKLGFELQEVLVQIRMQLIRSKHLEE